MGIRIQKILGWGLTDVINDGPYINLEKDKRFNLELSQNYDKFDSKIYNIEGFLNWVKDNWEECKEIVEKVQGRVSLADVNILLATNEEGKLNKNKLSYVYNYDPEFGDPSVMIFCPISCKDWTRHDDIIDYYEERGCSMEPKVQILNDCCGIWPYLNMIHIPGSPRYGEEDFPNSISPGEYNRMIGVFSEDMKAELTGETLEYYKKYYRPTISTCLILHLYWLNIFSDFYKTIHELKPMIYTYWA